MKNILGALGLEVTRLIRISYGPFQLGELPEGHVQEIKGRMLRDQLGERLIEESGANFEAPVVKPFSNKPVQRASRSRGPKFAERPKIVRDGVQGRIGEGGLIKNRKRDRDSDARRRARQAVDKPDATKPRARRWRRRRAFEKDARLQASDGRVREGPSRFGRRAATRASASERPIEPPGAQVECLDGAGRAAAGQGQDRGRKGRAPTRGKAAQAASASRGGKPASASRVATADGAGRAATARGDRARAGADADRRR